MTGTQDSDSRIGAALAVAALHVSLFLALLGLGHVPTPHRPTETLTLVDIAEPPPPPAVAPDPPGLPAPRADPVPIAIPPRIVETPVPEPVVAAPAAASGTASQAGAADRGSGTGAGGAGNGLGGGAATRARLVAGRIDNRDYPRAASRSGATGEVTVQFTVGVDGRATGCAVTISSGNADLDATTCALIEDRFRYAPARDSTGQAVPEVRGWRQSWWFEPRN